MDRDEGWRSGDWEGVLRAGRVLFGQGADAILGRGAWRRELKRAYRRRALETHPDRARSLGRSEVELAREFKAVVEAYQLLLAATESAPGRRARATAGDERAPARGRASARAAERPRSPPAEGRRREPDRAAKGAPRAKGAERPRDGVRPAAAASPRVGTPFAVPIRRVRLGEYLFYTRRIPFEALVEAIAWQRGQRPPVGRIAIECGFLTHEQVVEVMERRRSARESDVPFAEYATRLGLLTPFARLAVLGRQQRQQRRIGRFFVERGWVTEEVLAAARAEMLLHNLRHGERASPAAAGWR